MTAFQLVTPPSVEPVLLADALAQARIDTTADNTLIGYLITAARQWAENYTGRAFITQSWQMALDLWPAMEELWWDGVREGPATGLDRINAIAFPRPPLLAVTGVQYFDNNDNATTWDSSNYFVDTVREPGRLALRLGATWPVPSRLANGIVISYTAGYGADGSYVPEQIKTAIRQLISHWYENRGEAMSAPTTRGQAIAPLTPVPLVIQALLDPFRVRTTRSM